MELLAMARRAGAAQPKTACNCILWASGKASLPKVRRGARRSATADNHRLILNVCFNYGGRWDIAQTQLAGREGYAHHRSKPARRHGHVPCARSLI